MRTTPLRLEQVKRLYATQRSARTLLSFAAQQTTITSGVKTTVDGLQEMLEHSQHSRVNRRELISTLRAFAAAGCGQFFTGRHGHPSRFVWAVPLEALGAAVGIGPPANASANRDKTNPSEPKLFAHPFRLRPALSVSLQLPDDLTANEAERLARFIQTLPLGG